MPALGGLESGRRIHLRLDDVLATHDHERDEDLDESDRRGADERGLEAVGQRVGRRVAGSDRISRVPPRRPATWPAIFLAGICGSWRLWAEISDAGSVRDDTKPAVFLD
jgi:hypothetical protein